MHALRKIQEEKGLEPPEVEDSVAQAFFDPENSNQELMSDLGDPYINNAFQMDVAGSREAVCDPSPLLPAQGLQEDTSQAC